MADEGAPAPAKQRRHRFQRVRERVQNLQSELQLHAKSNAVHGELSFVEELQLQGELTTLESFQLLHRQLQPLVTTTPQLLHHLAKVVRVLQDELTSAKEDTQVQRERIVPVLKLITALARELRKEFYPHFAATLPLIVAVIDTKDPELSTQVFKTLTMLFNYLRAQLLKDMDAVHKCYFPLLGHPRDFVREFAAQTLAVLLRRIDNVKDMKKYLAAYLRALTRGAGKDDEILQDGSAKLFFALVRNVNHGFHSRMRDVVLFLLGSFRPKEAKQGSSTDDGEEERAQIEAQRAVVFTIVSKTCALMNRHTDGDHSSELLDCFTLAVTKAASVRKTEADSQYVARLINVLTICVRFRAGKLVHGDAKRIAAVHKVCVSVLSDSTILSSTCHELRDNLLLLFEAVWRLFPTSPTDMSAQVRAFFDAARHDDGDSEVAEYWRSSLLEYIKRTLQHAYVTVDFVKQFIFPNAVELAFTSLLRVDIDAFSRLMCDLGAYIPEHGDVVDENDYLLMSRGQCLVTYPANSLFAEDKVLLDVGRKLLSSGVAKPQASESSLAIGWKFCKALALIRINDSHLNKFVLPLISQIDNKIKALDGQETIVAQLHSLRGELWRLQLSAQHHSGKQLPGKEADVLIERALQGKASSYANLAALREYITWKTVDELGDMLNSNKLAGVAELLMQNLRSASHAMRLVSLEILARFDKLKYVNSDDDSATFSGECELLDVCVSLERTCAKISVDTEREAQRLIGRVKILSRSSQTPLVYKRIAVNQLLGLYHVKFSTLWPHIADAIEPTAQLHFADAWPYISAELSSASFRQESSNNEPAASSHSSDDNKCDASVLQEFEAVCQLESNHVDSSTSTDLITHHSLLWKGLEKFSDLVESKTKFIVPLFLAFLRDQYAHIYSDEIDKDRLHVIDQLLAKVETKPNESTAVDAVSWREPQAFSQLTTKSVRSKLIDQLKLFAKFNNMKGAFANAFLHDFCFDLLMKSDEVISKLALKCLYGFEKKHLAAYKTQLDRIADSTTFREELTSFDISEAAGTVLQEHRAHLVPVLMRVLYSKCVSKKGRNSGDTVAARRAAILAYLAALDVRELASFVELVVRAFDVKIELTDEGSASATGIASVQVASVQPSRVLGFLNLLEDLIGQLGVKLATFVPSIANVLVSILRLNEESDDDAEHEAMEVDQDDDDVAASSVDVKEKPEYTSGMRKQVRTLTLRRLAEVVDTFDSLVPLGPWVADFLDITRDSVLRLQKTVVGAEKASALFELLLAVARADRSRSYLSEELVLSTISCLAAGLKSGEQSNGVTPDILEAILQFMGSLLDGDEDLTDSSATRQLIPHIPFVLKQFVQRFQAKAARYARDRYAGSARKELTFLCRLSTHLEESATDLGDDDELSTSAHNLFQLLVPFLQRSHRASEADKENILQVLAQIVPLLSDPRKHVLALSKLLAPGPNCVNERSTRAKLIDVFVALGNHKATPSLASVAELLASLNAYDVKKIEEVDFERRMDALNQVNQSSFGAFTHDTHLLAPVISQYLTCLHDSEFSIRSAALAGMTTFVGVAAKQAEGGVTAADKSPVLNALESLVMPSVRYSLRSSIEDVRRGFVSLLGHVADHHAELGAFPFVHSDLALLRNKEDPEADFFYNITHIQAHRKRRALQRLSTLLNQMAEKQQAATALGDEAMSDTREWFSNSTVNNVLLPLVLHFIFEAQAKSQESIRTEAAACVGSAAGLLGWSHYLALLRRLLKSIDGHAEMENTIIAAVCEVIDHFHFASPGAATRWEKSAKRAPGAARRNGEQAKPTVEKTSTNEDEDNDTDEDETMNDADGAPVESTKVQDSMEAQVLPMMKKYLFKAVTAKGAAKASTASFEDDAVVSQAVTVRAPLALAIVKVLRRLRAATFYFEFPKLLMSFTKLLKNKDEAVRTSARQTLVNITAELGIGYLFPIVDELRHTLRDGYMVHVLSFTIHSVLEKVSTMVSLPKPPSLLESGDSASPPRTEDYASPLDECVPNIMHILVEELFKDAIENQDGSAPHKSKMKEARANGRSYDSLELLARTIGFLPNPSIHSVLSALVDKYRIFDSPKATLILQESLKRVALGLVKNPAVEPSYVYLLAYNMLQSCLEAVRPATEKEKAKYSGTGSSALVTSWLVNEKSARATAELAKRVRARDAAKVTHQGRMTGYDRHNVDGEANEVSTAHLDELMTFAVLLVYTTIRSGAVSPQLVDPLVPLLMRCAAEVKNNRAIVNALKCLTLLLNQHELAAMDIAIEPLVARLFKILQKAGAATRNEMVQTCYRALTTVLKARPTYKLTEAQLRVILSFVRADLEEKDHQNATYSLLKAVIASRLVVNEVYDVMLRVGELLVQSDAQSARANCSSIYLTFLLEYPLGPKRLTHHFKFLLNNLAYTYESGRKAVLETIGALVKKLPIDLLNDRAQFFLLPLVLRLANDEASACRLLAAEAITTLIRRMGNHQLNESVGLFVKWWHVAPPADAKPGDDVDGERVPVIGDPKLLCTAAQVTALVLASRPEFMDRSASDVLDNAKRALTRCLADVRSAVDSAAIDWQVAFHVVECLTKFSTHLGGAFESWFAREADTNTPTFMKSVVLPLLEFPHEWVRLAALRLINSYLTRRSAQSLQLTRSLKKLDKSIVGDGDKYLKRPGTLFSIASSVGRLLERSGKLGDDVAREVLELLPFLMNALVAFPDILQNVSTQGEASDSEEEDGFASGDEAEEEEDKAEEKDAGKTKTPVGWLLTRLSFVSRTADPSVQVVIFKLFAALIATHDAAFVQQYVMQMLNPLYRTTTANAEKEKAAMSTPAAAPAPSESAMLAQEVLELLEKKLGGPAFLEAYTFVQKKIAVFRATRREKRKREAVNEPELAAQRKLRKNEGKRHAKQLKKRKFAVMKGTASAATRPRKVLRPGAE